MAQRSVKETSLYSKGMPVRNSQDQHRSRRKCRPLRNEAIIHICVQLYTSVAIVVLVSFSV